MISPLAYVDPEAKIGKNVTIHPFAYIEKDVVIGDNNTIMSHASILEGTRMGDNNTVYLGAVVSAVPQDFAFTGESTVTIIGNNNNIRENVIINRATHSDGCTEIGNDNFLMQGARISHDVKIGNGCIIGNGSHIAGLARIDDNAIITACVLINQHCRVGSWSVVQGGCRTNKDIPPYIIAAHEPIAFHAINSSVLNKQGFAPEIVKNIASAYRLIYHFNTSIEDALDKIREQVDMSPEIEYILNFIKKSERGIIR